MTLLKGPLIFHKHIVRILFPIGLSEFTVWMSPLWPRWLALNEVAVFNIKQNESAAEMFFRFSSFAQGEWLKMQ